MTDPAGPCLACYTDGASRGNPGPSAYAYILVREGRKVRAGSGFLGTGTNNAAEYMAVIRCLRDAARLPCTEITVFSDSELVVRQLQGRYVVRAPHLKELFSEVREAVRLFRAVGFVHVPRDNPWIAEADRMANEVLDRQG